MDNLQKDQNLFTTIRNNCFINGYLLLLTGNPAQLKQYERIL